MWAFYPLERILFICVLRILINYDFLFLLLIVHMCGSFTLIFLCCCIRNFMSIYLYSLLGRNTCRKNNLHFFLIFFYFLIKKYFSNSKSIGVQKVRRSFRCIRLKQTGYRILEDERNQIFLPMTSSLSVCALQPGTFKID